MDQSNALEGQEEIPENSQPVEQTPAESHTGNMESLLQEEGLNLDFPKQGEIRTGVIASISEGEILVSVGTKSEGVISGKEKDQIPSETLAAFHVGQEIPVYVLNPEDQNGNLVLSFIRAREEQDWLDVEELLRSGNVFDGSIIGYNKGGLIVPIGTLRGFVPASQVSVMRRPDANADTVDARWSKMVGEPIRVTVIEVDRQRHRLILSERSALQETRETIKDRLLDELKEGDIRTGRVTSLADFGAFVNIDGADGLVHLSEISWDRIEHPSEVLKIGQEVKVKIIAVDQDRKRIGLSIRQLQSDPWVVKASSLKEGQLLEGTITHLTKFGAFARLSGEMEGLIHISELSEQRINHPKEVVKEGDVVTLRVIKIDTERRRIGLSLRKVDSAQYADLDWKMMISNEVQDSQKEQAAEAHDAQKEQAAEAQDVQKEQPVEAHDVQKEQAAEAPVKKKKQPVEVKQPKQEKPAEVQQPQPEEPAEVKQPQPEKPAEVKQPKPEKPAEVKQPKPEKPAEVKQPQAEESAEVQEPQPEESAEVQDSPEEPPAAEEAS